MPKTPPPTAWTEADLADPHAAVDKPQRVQRMFAAIARRYDLNNRLHSFGLDQHWRRRAVALCRVRPGQRVLDVACGTADLAIAFARTPAGCILAADFTWPMLALAANKLARLPADHRPVHLMAADALALPLPDRSMDVVAIAFGLRNLADPADALAEFRRVLRPGGRLCILEFANPSCGLLRPLHRFYTRHLMPITASLIAGDRSGAYRYLPRSIDTFLERRQLAGLMAQMGLANVSVHPLAGGIAVIYLGHRP